MQSLHIQVFTQTCTCKFAVVPSSDRLFILVQVDTHPVFGYPPKMVSQEALWAGVDVIGTNGVG